MKTVSGFLVDNWQFFATNLVVLLGFAITTFQVKNDIIKIKTEKNIDELRSAYEFAVKMIQSTSTRSDAQRVKEINNFIETIVSYSGKSTQKVVASYMQDTFQDKLEPLDTVAYFALIVSSLRYDMTGESIKPTRTLQMKLNDYQKIRFQIMLRINKIVITRRLNMRLLTSM